MFGSIIGAAANIGGSLIQNNWSKRAAQDQMDFQKGMSDTAHQREVKDLMAAGLNPNLSAGGNGSSTPTGATPSFQAPQIDMPGIMSVLNQTRQLDQADRKIDIDESLAKTAIKKSGVDQDYTKVKTRATGKGAIRATLEDKAAKWLEKSLKAPSPLQQPKLNNVGEPVMGPGPKY